MIWIKKMDFFMMLASQTSDAFAVFIFGLLLIGAHLFLSVRIVRDIILFSLSIRVFPFIIILIAFFYFN